MTSISWPRSAGATLSFLHGAPPFPKQRTPHPESPSGPSSASVQRKCISVGAVWSGPATSGLPETKSSLGYTCKRAPRPGQGLSEFCAVGQSGTRPWAPGRAGFLGGEAGAAQAKGATAQPQGPHGAQGDSPETAGRQETRSSSERTASRAPDTGPARHNVRPFHCLRGDSPAASIPSDELAVTHSPGPTSGNVFFE